MQVDDLQVWRDFSQYPYKVYYHTDDPLLFRIWGASKNWIPVNDATAADFVVFTGGPDVCPSIYGAKKHPKTYVNPTRDKLDEQLWAYVNRHNVPSIGICRGAQFINVKCGGSLVQDVYGHTSAHDVQRVKMENSKPVLFGETFRVTSTHHQMMIPTPNGLLFAGAHKVAKSFALREPADPQVPTSWGYVLEADPIFDHSVEPEVVLYPNEAALCFQPHPEYDPGGPTDKLFDEAFKAFEVISGFCDN